MAFPWKEYLLNFTLLFFRVCEFGLGILVFVLGGVIPITEIHAIPNELQNLSPFVQVPPIAYVSLATGVFAILSVVCVVILWISLVDSKVGCRLLVHVFELTNCSLSLVVTSLLGLQFNLATGNQPLTCSDFIASGSLAAAFPDWNPTASVPAGYTQVSIACQCRDAGIAFGACALVAWGMTFLISCWFVWRDVIKRWLRRMVENETEERHPSEEENANKRSGRTRTNEIELEAPEEWPEGSQPTVVYNSGTTSHTYPSINATELTSDEVDDTILPSGRIGPSTETEIPSGDLRAPNTDLSGRLQESA